METQNIDNTKMYIRIKPNSYAWQNTEMNNWLKNNWGKLVEVETDHLFDNQYNTEKYRILDANVCEVLNDARTGKGKCNYCGNMLTRGEVCRKHSECKTYGISWFTPENTFFLKYPKGIENVKAIEGPLKIGSYFLTANPEGDYLRLNNARKTINFKFKDGKYFVLNGIGWKQVNRLDIPFSAMQKLNAKIKELI